jgi:electron transfer flavoprotein alpha subunit
MPEIAVFIEHRQGELRDISLEMLTIGRELSSSMGGTAHALLLGHPIDELVKKVTPWAHRVSAVDDPLLGTQDAEACQRVLAHLIPKVSPAVLLIGQTAAGIDLAPSLAVELGYPLVSDCIGLAWEDDTLVATRQIHGGKIEATVHFVKAPTYIATVRPSAFKIEEATLRGEVVTVDSPLTGEIASRKFIEYLEEAAGDIDISQADVVVGVGRGIREQENMEVIEKLAEALGGVIGCSRPVVDAGWLPKNRQIGSSGKTIKPKLYLAIGISGAFQHVAGMKSAETIVAVNKDPHAPIFSSAHYGIIGDLFKVVPQLTEKVMELKK